MNEEKIKVAVAGASGRMGSTIISLLNKCPDMQLAWAFEAKGHTSIGKEVLPGIKISDGFENAPQSVDVLIDFTSPEATLTNIEHAKKKKTKLVIGTTGFSQEQMITIKDAANHIPLIISPNMSIGVNIMMEIVESATRMLGDDYEVEIIETHHHNKKDAPSGTALKIGEIVNRVRNRKDREGFVYGRQGKPGPRTKDEIGIHSVRISEIIGEHSVLFGGTGEILEITHKCFSRESFASGAISAARFIYSKSQGFYEMKDVIDWLRKSR
jgi:4-hydroxy-tetrahydrodipicolinate reductase